MISSIYKSGKQKVSKILEMLHSPSSSSQVQLHFKMGKLSELVDEAPAFHEEEVIENEFWHSRISSKGPTPEGEFEIDVAWRLHF